MTKGFNSCDPPSQKGKTNSWLTPLSLVNSLGEFDLDPCGFKYHKTANNIYQLPQDGLLLPWSGRVWLNPPYGKEAKFWLKKMDAHGSGVALLFARLETVWLQEFLNNGFFQIQGRVAFLTENLETVSNAGCGSILIPFSYKDEIAIKKSGIKGRFFK
jgi:hypothetical protein